jgi:tetratricopeptide (TPR) repeat protein
MAAGKFGLAARELEAILTSNPRSDEAAYVLGLCEQARRRNHEAEQAWARVRPGSSFIQRAILARLRLFHDTGKLSAAEKIVIDAAADPRNDRTELLVLLVPIYSQIGRADEAERLLEERWEHLRVMGKATPDESIKLVRLHIELGLQTRSTDELKLYLDQVGRLAPDDDRVWLGRANLAIQTGAHDEAKHWLEACRGKRPDDVPVWRAWLNWGVATNRVDVVEEAANHLPAAESTQAEIHRLGSWFCAQRGDLAGERRQLARLAAANPGDLKTIDRLIAIADKSGDSPHGEELRNKKAHVIRLLDRYQRLYDRTQHVRDAEEMAQIAGELGRPFEAKVFLTLATEFSPDRDDLRRDLERLTRNRAPRADSQGETLAEALERDAAGDLAIERKSTR